MKTKILSTITFILLIQFSQGQTIWRKYSYPYFGIDFEMPTCGFKDSDDCTGMELITESYIGDFAITSGIVSKYDEDYELTHPYSSVKASAGNAPNISLSKYPNLSHKIHKEDLYFMKYDDGSTGYVFRYYFKLNEEFFYYLMLEGEDQDFDLEDEDEVIELNNLLSKEKETINKILKSIKFYSPKDIKSSLNPLSTATTGFDKKISSKIVKFDTGPWAISTPIIRIDKKDFMHLLYLNEKDGVHINKMSLSGTTQKKTLLKQNYTFFDFDLFEDGYVLLASKSKYDEDDKVPSNYFEELHILFIDFNGNTKWDKIIVPEIYITKSGDIGFEHYGRGCVRLKATQDKVIAYYTKRMNPGDGKIHQGDGFTILNSKGEILAHPDWYVSHSFGQEISTDSKGVTLVALGDGHPRAINVSRINLSSSIINTPAKNGIFPFKGSCGDNYIGDTRVSNVISDDKNSYFAITTEEGINSSEGDGFLGKKANDIILIGVSHEGKEVFRKRVTNSPLTEENDPYITFSNGNIIVTWEVFDYYSNIELGLSERYAVFSKSGKTIQDIRALKTFSEQSMADLTKMGNDLSTNNRESRSNFVNDSKGNVYCVRIMPLIYKDYLEITKISK